MAGVFLLGVLITGYKFLDAKELGLIFDRLHWWTMIPLLALPISFLWLKAERFTDLFEISGAPVDDSKVRKITKASYVSAQLATLLPGGYVARIALMESSLQRGAKAVLPTLIEKVLDLALLFLVGFVASCLYPQTQVLAAASALCLSLLLFFAASKGLRTRVRLLMTRIGSKFVKASLVREALDARKPSLGLALSLSVQTVGVLLIELAILWGAFAALDLQVSPLILLLAYGVADLVGRIAPTPGGFGVTELGMVALLHNLAGMNPNEAAAATFLFRFLLFLVPAIYGSLCYLFVWIPAHRSN